MVWPKSNNNIEMEFIFCHIQSFVCQFFWALVFLAVKWGCCCCCLVAQSCPTLCYTMDRSPPVAPLSMGILQARVLDWVAMPSSRRSSQPRDRIQISHIADGFFTVWATRAAQEYWSEQPIPSFSRGYSWPRNRIGVFCIAGGFFTSLATREDHETYYFNHI